MTIGDHNAQRYVKKSKECWAIFIGEHDIFSFFFSAPQRFAISSKNKGIVIGEKRDVFLQAYTILGKKYRLDAKYLGNLDIIKIVQKENLKKKKQKKAQILMFKLERA